MLLLNVKFNYITFPFNFLILQRRSFFFIALTASNDNLKSFVVFSAITINQVNVEELKISLGYQQNKRKKNEKHLQ